MEFSDDFFLPPKKLSKLDKEFELKKEDIDKINKSTIVDFYKSKVKTF